MGRDVIPDGFVGACCLVNKKRRPILIDADDLPLVGDIPWKPHVLARTKSGDYEYATHQRGGKLTLLHRALTGCPPGMVVDHINGDRLDNRRANLRICTHRENLQNTALRTDNKLGLKGVFKLKQRYVAAIKVDGRIVRLGSFASAELAHAAYCSAAKRFYGEFARFA